MCGRFTLTTPAQRVAAVFLTKPPADFVPRFNIAPTQPIIVIRPTDAASQHECVWMRWGLIPSWSNADDARKTALMNARSETVATKPAFSFVFKRRRCLIPADGFFEWKKDGKKRLPYFIHRPGREPFAFAGLWDRWVDPEGAAVESCTIVTTEANGLLTPLHDRMPLILAAADYDRWLDRRLTTFEELGDLLRPVPDDALTMYPVGLMVNNARSEFPECVEPLPEAQDGNAQSLFPD
jgi:putative SOS response-associated peptidase YedK